MKQFVKPFLALLALLLISCSPNNSSPSMAEVVGTYVGQYGNGMETFQILEDGTFKQKFQIGTNTIYNIDGKWQQTQTNLITFTPFFVPRAVLGRNSDIKLASGSGTWHRNPLFRIEFGPWPYFVRKISGQGTTAKQTTD